MCLVAIVYTCNTVMYIAWIFNCHHHYLIHLHNKLSKIHLTYMNKTLWE